MTNQEKITEMLKRYFRESK